MGYIAGRRRTHAPFGFSLDKLDFGAKEPPNMSGWGGVGGLQEKRIKKTEPFYVASVNGPTDILRKKIFKNYEKYLRG